MSGEPKPPKPLTPQQETKKFTDLFDVVNPTELVRGETYVLFRTGPGRAKDRKDGFAVKLRGIYTGDRLEGQPAFKKLRVPYEIEGERGWRPRPDYVGIPSSSPSARWTSSGTPTITASYRAHYAYPRDLTEAQAASMQLPRKWEDRVFYPMVNWWIFAKSKVDSASRTLAQKTGPDPAGVVGEFIPSGGRRRRGGNEDDFPADDYTPDGLDEMMMKAEFLDAESGGRRKTRRRKPSRKTRRNRV